MRIGFLDIESSNLDADFGILLSWSLLIWDTGNIKPVKNEFWMMWDGKNEKEMVDKLFQHIKTCDTIVTYYGSRFDIPYLRAKALEFHLLFPNKNFAGLKIRHIDLYYTIRYRLKIHSNTLESICNYLHIRGKTALNPYDWKLAQQGNSQSLLKILQHNKMDVVILYRLFKKVKNFLPDTVRWL